MIRQVRRNTTISNIISILFGGGADPDEMAAALGSKPDTIRKCLYRAERSGLIKRDLSLTRRGRLYHIADSLGVSLHELAALASVYHQISSWDRMPGGNDTRRFAVREYCMFGGHTTSGARAVYTRLISRGMVQPVARGRLLEMAPRTMDAIRPYLDDMLDMYHAMRGGPAGPF